MEEFHQYVSRETDYLAYHTPSNVGIVPTPLNFLRGLRPSVFVCLPGLARLFKARDEPDQILQQRQMAWAFSALTNIATMYLGFP